MDINDWLFIAIAIVMFVAVLAVPFVTDGDEFEDESWLEWKDDE